MTAMQSTALTHNHRRAGGDGPIPKKTFRIDLKGLALLSLAALIVAMGLIACQPKAPDKVPAGKKSEAPVAPTRPEVPLAWRSDGFEGSLKEVRVEDGRLALDLALPAAGKAPRQTVSFNLCLPDNQSFDLTIKRYTIDGRELEQAEPPAKPRKGDIKAPTTKPARPNALQALELKRKGYIRNWGIWRLGIKDPFWTPLAGGAKKELTATIEISWRPGRQAGAGRPRGNMINSDSGMLEALRRLVADPQGLERWAVQNPPFKSGLSELKTDPRPLAPKARQWARIRITEDGLYRLTLKELAQAGWPAGAETLKKVRLFSHGRELPVSRVIAGDEKKDGVYFYGWRSRTPYDPEQVYWAALTEEKTTPSGSSWPEAAPALMQGKAIPLSVIRRTVRLNRDNNLKIQQGDFLSIEGMVWVDAKLAGPKPIAIPLALDHPAPLAGQPKLDGLMKFYPDGNDPKIWDGTEAALSQDDKKLAGFSFRPANGMEQPFKLPSAVFASGATTLTLSVTKPTSSTLSVDDEEGIWLDTAEIHYQALPYLQKGRLILDRDAVTSAGLYRLSLPEAGGASLMALAVKPDSGETCRLRLDNGSLVFPRRDGWQAEVYDLASAATPAVEPVKWNDAPLAEEGADYLIITHSLFKDALGPLLELNRSRGLKTRVVDIQDLYDLFSDGMLSPEAIHSYLAYTMRHWRGGGPQYVLLVGDATSDYMDQTRSGVKNYVPSYTHQYGAQKSASDYWFSCVAGDDDLPDFMLGRLSVSAVEDARTVIAKTVRYATEKTFGPWRATMGYVADNSEQFESTSELLRTRCSPAAIEGRRVYLNQMPLEDNWYIPQSRIERVWAEEKNWMKVSAASTGAIKNLFNGGVAELDYFGHGSPNIWTDERIWFGGGSPNRDSQYLKADGRYAFVVNFTCNSGAIDYPMPRWNTCITEDLMNTPDGGAVGCFVPSGPGSTPIHELLGRQWRAALFEDNLRRTGEIAFLARTRYALEGSSPEMLYIYILMGDPALEMKLTRCWQELRLDPAVVVPGQGGIVAHAEGVKPESGRAVAWIENEKGAQIWKSEPVNYEGGKISLPIQAPAEGRPAEKLRVAVYGWNEEANGDFIAAGTLNVGRPWVDIQSAQAVRLGEGRVRFEVELVNKSELAADGVTVRIGGVDGAGDKGEMRLPEAQAVKLAGGEARKIELEGTVGQGAGPVALEAVASMSYPPDGLGLPASARKAFAVLPEGPWIGLAPWLSRWRVGPGTNPPGEIVVGAASTVKPEGAYSIRRRTAAGQLASEQTVTFTDAGGVYTATVNLATTARGKAAATSDTLELLERKGGSAAAPRVVGKMDLGAIPQVEPRLQIKAGSIKHAPESPTDGETLYISFEVENVGNAPAPGCAPALLDKPLKDGGQKLPLQPGSLQETVPELGVGRSCPVTLRWDPIRNAGVQTVWVDLNPNPGRDERALNEQVASYRFYVKTKSNLVRVKPPWPSRSSEDILAGVYKLHMQVANQGETDAHGVEVLYYRSEDKREEDLLGTVLLKVVPAKKTSEAVLECKLSPKDRPAVEIRLKGSAQRLGH